MKVIQRNVFPLFVKTQKDFYKIKRNLDVLLESNNITISKLMDDKTTDIYYSCFKYKRGCWIDFYFPLEMLKRVDIRSLDDLAKRINQITKIELVYSSEFLHTIGWTLIDSKSRNYLVYETEFSDFENFDLDYKNMTQID